MINIAVCDDSAEEAAMLHNYIERYFRNFTRDFCIKVFTDGNELLISHSQKEFDVLFLDIDMPKVTGFDIAKSLRDSFSKCCIVFVTSHSDLVYRSFDFQPFNFVRKNPEMLEKSLKNVVAKLMENMKQNESIVLEDEISGKIAVYYRNIMYIKSKCHYLYYYLDSRSEPVKIRGSINEIEGDVEKYGFARAHKSYIINLRYVLNIDSKIGRVSLNHESKKLSLPMSKSYEKSFDRAHTMYLRSML